MLFMHFCTIPRVKGEGLRTVRVQSTVHAAVRQNRREGTKVTNYGLIHREFKTQ